MSQTFEEEPTMSGTDNIRSRERLHRDRQIDDVVHDPYRERYKPKAPAFCPTCGAVYQDGHWQWLSHPAHAHEHVCPACHRISDRQPAGYVTLQSQFHDKHVEEMIALIRHEEARAKAEHPLERIMAVERLEHETSIQTTDVHLARRLGDAVHHAYQGQLEIQYAQDQYLVRIYWTR
jgi:hypothetical protein